MADRSRHEPQPGVPARRPSLFCDVDLAARVERAEARLMADVVDAAGRGPAAQGLGDGFAIAVAIAIAGGFATFVEPGSPYNKVAGLGFAGVPSGSELDAVEAAFADRDAPVQIELAHLADPAVLDVLVGRGYRLISFENVLGRDLSAVPPASPGIEVRRSLADDLDQWLAVVTEAAMHPDDEGLPMEDFPRDVLERAERHGAGAAGVRRYTALRDGQPAGGASWRPAGDVAQLTGAGTLPAHRRHGVQSTLLAVRLAEAVAVGCDLAVVTTQPGSRSQRNAQRQGFDLLYTRAVLVK